jgi:hypothetical protein
MKNSSKFLSVAMLCIALPYAMQATTGSKSGSTGSKSGSTGSKSGSTDQKNPAVINVATQALAIYDEDHDQALDKQELVKFKAADATLEATALTYDIDHDGVLNPTEIAAWVAASGKSNDVASKSGSSSSKSKKTSK